MNNGWIKLHRSILTSPVGTSKDAILFQLWIHILLSVNYEDRTVIFNNKRFVVHAGQGIFGINQIVKDCTKYVKEKSPVFKKMKTTYYRRLKTLENIGNVKLQPNNKFTLITVLNWEKYQSDETPVKLKRNSSETLVKTLKERKEIKNDKELFSSLSEIQETHFEQLAQENRISVTTVAGKYQDLVDYCQATGKVYKNYLAALRSWIRKDIVSGKISQEKSFEQTVREENPGATII